MLQKSICGTTERWPEKSAGVLKPLGWIALIFLDFLVRFASRQNEYLEKINNPASAEIFLNPRELLDGEVYRGKIIVQH